MELRHHFSFELMRNHRRFSNDTSLWLSKLLLSWNMQAQGRVTYRDLKRKVPKYAPLLD